jgi:predicted O-methyltransferase YrrM
MPTWTCAEEVDGWMRPTELQWLREMAKGCESVLEIGSWKGRSTWALCESCPGIVHAVDHWAGSEDGNIGAFEELKYMDVHQIFLNNVGHFPNLRVHKMKSRAFAKDKASPRSLDMVFIDGDHSEGACYGDLVDWGWRAKKVLCGHDADWKGVQKALDHYAPGRWRVVCDSIWMVELGIGVGDAS